MLIVNVTENLEKAALIFLFKIFFMKFIIKLKR